MPFLVLNSRREWNMLGRKDNGATVGNIFGKQIVSKPGDFFSPPPRQILPPFCLKIPWFKYVNTGVAHRFLLGATLW